MKKIIDEINDKYDEKYAKFSSKLIPNSNYKQNGLRIPDARNIAKKYINNKSGLEFLKNLPHNTLDQNNVHGLMLGYLMQELDIIINYVEQFLPYIDNWETCDITVCNLKIFKKYPQKVKKYAKKWLKSTKPFTKRFAIVVFLSYFLDQNFEQNDLILLSKIESDNYYVNMALAWYFSVALVKQYDITKTIFINKLIVSKWVHNKAIQKALESYRIDDTKKVFLKSLKYL